MFPMPQLHDVLELVKVPAGQVAQSAVGERHPLLWIIAEVRFVIPPGRSK
jgi:hypothetical protein